MTEKEIRQKYVDTAASYVGNLKGMTAEMQAMYDIYNSKLEEENARWGTRKTKMIMSPSWGWCVCFTSTIGIICGFDTVVPCEIGPYEIYKIAVAHGIWKNNAYEPKAGDLILYDWVSDGKGDWDHIEIVESYANGYVNTIGGNNGEKPGVCSRRTISHDDSQIIGYIAPNYYDIASEEPKTDERAEKALELLNSMKIGDVLEKVSENEYTLKHTETENHEV